MCASYKSKSRNTDFEQHANKIFTAIREIDPEYAEKRAIWELFQNALDIVVDKGIIKITKTEKGFRFEHNGRPFNDGNLTGLIKQSSNGKSYGSNKNETGQYGTGFLSTHVYGQQIEISASVQTDSNKIKHLDKFLLDRKAVSPDDLNEKIQIQDENAEEICDGAGNELTEHLTFTSFEYIESDDSNKYISNMFDYIPEVLPFIFAFNNKLYSVEVTNSTKTHFQRNDTNQSESQLNLLINNKPLNFSYLFDKEKNIKIILPQNDFNFEYTPKLFLFYPLMQTTEIGLNFLIHAQEFKPNKERDFLFLKTSNEGLKTDVETNKSLLGRAFELILNQVESDVTIDFLSVINVKFIEDEDLFLNEKKTEFINSIKSLEKIGVKNEKVALTSIWYLHEDILLLDDNVVEDLYELLSQFYNLPNFDEYIYISKLVNNWLNESFEILHYSEILNKIYLDTKGNYSNVIYKNGYQTLIKTISTDLELLNKNKAIPNIHNEFCFIKSLKKWDLIEESLIEVMDSINNDISSCFLNNDFYFLENTLPYTRENFKDDINKFNGDIIALLEKNEEKSLNVNSVRFNSLIFSLVNFIGLNKTTSTNLRFSEFFLNHYELGITAQTIESPTVDLSYDSSFKLLSRLFIKEITSKGGDFIENSINDLAIFVGILHSNSELKKNLLDKLACFPNQLFKLKPQNDLKIDKVLDTDFKLKHKEITGLQIKDDLLIPQFEKFISHTTGISGMQLGDEIETKLTNEKDFFPLLNNTSKIPILLDLVKYIIKSNSKWSFWLPNLNKVKQEVLMTKFKDEATRLSLFNILSIDSKEKINLLGELAQIDDLDSLIKAGKEKQKEEGRKNNHLQYINQIGLKIQNLVQSKLDIELAETIKIVESTTDEKLITEEEQNGQDFIIYKSGNPIYFIEVKSRWASDGIVALSKRQTECCAKNKDNYAVITVNVADYKSRNNIVEENISFDELSNDIYVNVDLGENFEELIKENQQFEIIKEKTKLIEFRGHIPQERIRKSGINFEKFIEELKITLLDA
jgi:hypothetical protein